MRPGENFGDSDDRWSRWGSGVTRIYCQQLEYKSSDVILDGLRSTTAHWNGFSSPILYTQASTARSRLAVVADLRFNHRHSVPAPPGVFLPVQYSETPAPFHAFYNKKGQSKRVSLAPLS